MIAPVVLGQGKRLFGAGTPPREMRLLDRRVGSGGVIVARYAPAGPVEVGDITPPGRSALGAERQRVMAAGRW